LNFAGLVVLGLAVCGAAFAGAATWATWRFLRRPAEVPARFPAVTVLKPLHGGEPQLYENLASFCAQRYAGPVQIILGAQDAADPALEIARRVRNDHPDCDITVVADPTLHGANLKIGNLINMAGHARGEVIVISDSDVRIPPDGLGRMIAALEQPGVGLIIASTAGWAPRAPGPSWRPWM
jgi:ceramide glucosyltransferase